MKEFIYNLISKFVIEFEHSKVKEEEVYSWLMDSYLNKGFKGYLTNEYARLTRYLASTYRGDAEYKKVIAQMSILRKIENDAKNAYKESELLKEKQHATK